MVFLNADWKRRQIKKIEIFSELLFGWYKERKDEKPTFKRTFPIILT
jgi:hypothetical protein